MTTQKWTTLVIYLALATWAISTASAQTSGIIAWIFVVLAVAHLVEFLLVFRLLRSAPGSLGGHFIQTMLFGFMHWMPIKRQAAANT